MDTGYGLMDRQEDERNHLSDCPECGTSLDDRNEVSRLRMQRDAAREDARALMEQRDALLAAVKQLCADLEVRRTPRGGVSFNSHPPRPVTVLALFDLVDADDDVAPWVTP